MLDDSERSICELSHIQILYKAFHKYLEKIKAKAYIQRQVYEATLYVLRTKINCECIYGTEDIAASTATWLR